MSIANLSEAERLVAAAVQFRRHRSAAEISVMLGLKAHTVQYALKRLQERGVLRPWTLINPFALGFEEFEVLFTLSTAAQRTRSVFETLLKGHPQVVWYGVLGGTYQYGVRFIARGASEARRFLDFIEKRFPGIIAHKAVASILSFRSFPKRYLSVSKRVAAPEPITLEPLASVFSPDEKDVRLVRLLIETPEMSERDLARHSALARETVRSRLRKLRESGVVAGEVFLVSARALGYLAFRVLVFGRGESRTLCSLLDSFAAQDSSVVNTAHCLGAWDYELSIEVRDALESANIISRLYELGAQRIERLELLPVLEQGVSGSFLRTLKGE